MIEEFFLWVLGPGIRDNAVVTVVIGGPLSIYLAIVVNRLATFRTLKFTALTEIALLQKATMDSDSCMKAQITVRALLEIPVVALVIEGQVAAARELKTLRQNLRSYLLNEFDVEMSKRELHSYAQLQGNDWIHAQTDIYKRAQAVLRRTIGAIQGLRPNYLRILMFNFDDTHWLRRSDCGPQCEKPKQVV